MQRGMSNPGRWLGVSLRRDRRAEAVVAKQGSLWSLVAEEVPWGMVRGKDKAKYGSDNRGPMGAGGRR